MISSRPLAFEVLDRIQTVMICVYTMFIPLSFYYGIELRDSQEAFFQFGCVFLILINILCQKRSLMVKENIWLFSLIAWFFFVFCYYKFQVGNAVIMNTFLGVALYMTSCNSLKREHFSLVMKSIIVVCTLNCVYLMSQSLGYDPIFLLRGGMSGCDTAGSFGLKAAMGMYFGMAMAAFCYFNIFFGLVCLYPVYLSVCSGAVFGTMAGGLFLLWHRFRIWFWAGLIVCIIAGTFYIVKKDNPMGTNNTRFTMWSDTLKVSMKKPLTGWGLDGFRNVYGEKQFLFMRIGPKEVDYAKRENYVVSAEMVKTGGVPQGHRDLWDNAHFSLLQLFFEAGIVAVVLTCGFIYSMFKRFKRSFKSKEVLTLMAMFIVFLVSSFTQFPERLARLVYLIPLLMAFFIIYTETDETNTDNRAADRWA